MLSCCIYYFYKRRKISPKEKNLSKNKIQFEAFNKRFNPYDAKWIPVGSKGVKNKRPFYESECICMLARTPLSTLRLLLLLGICQKGEMVVVVVSRLRPLFFLPPNGNRPLHCDCDSGKPKVCSLSRLLL